MCSWSRRAHPAHLSGRRRSRRWTCDGSPPPRAWRRPPPSCTPVARSRWAIRPAMPTCSAHRSADRACRLCRRAGHPQPPTRWRCRSTLGRQVGDDIEIASRRLTHRRHRAQLDSTGQPAQHLPHHDGRAATGVRRPTAGRVDRDSRHARRGACRIQGHRPRRCDRRSAASAEGGGQLHHDRGGSALGRRGVDRGIGDLSLRARATAGLRGVQGDWRPDRFHRGRAGACRRSSSRCPRSLWASCFRRCSDRSSRCRSSSRPRPTLRYP